MGEKRDSQDWLHGGRRRRHMREPPVLAYTALLFGAMAASIAGKTWLPIVLMIGVVIWAESGE